MHFSFSSQEYLCCAVPSTVTTCLPRRPVGGLSTCNALLASKSLQFYIWIVGSSAFFGNIAAFVVHLKERKKKKNAVPSYLVANLAIADFAVSIYLLIIAVGDVMHRYQFFEIADGWLRNWNCLIACYICCSATLMSVFMMLLISIDRYICIVYPFSERKLKVKSATYSILGFWLFCLIFVGIPIGYSVGKNSFERLNGDSSVCMPSNLQNSYYRAWIGTFILLTGLCWITVCILYISIYFSVRRSNRKVRKSSSNNDTQIAVRLLLILVTDLITWIPFYVICLQVWFDNKSIDAVLLQLVSIIFIPMNSIINPCLYTLSSGSVAAKARYVARMVRSVTNQFTLNRMSSVKPSSVVKKNIKAVDVELPNLLPEAKQKKEIAGNDDAKSGFATEVAAKIDSSANQQNEQINYVADPQISVAVVLEVQSSIQNSHLQAKLQK